MNRKTQLLLYFLSILIIGCAKRVNYSAEHIKETSGKYLYNPEELIDVYYKDNTLYIKWKGAEKIEPVIIDEYTFFMADMYAKLRFTVHPETGERYLSTVSPDDDTKVTYDYLKVSDSYKTPSMHLKAGNFDEALKGYLALREQDSTSVFINEREFNSYGYELLRKKEYDHAVEVFKMNVALYPESDNVYDSLAEGYLRSGDSLQAFTNYSKALELDSGNKRAKRYIEAYNSNTN